MRTINRHIASGCWVLFIVALIGCSGKPKNNDRRKKEYQVTSPNLFLWEITSAENTVYLMGSLHIGTDDLYPLPEAINDAFAKSKRLAVEANMTKVDAAEVQRFISEKGTYRGGETLTSHLSKEAAERLRGYCEQSGTSLDALQRLKPWVVNLQLQTMEIMKAGYSPTKGIDWHFIEKANDAGKPTDELETMQEELDLLARFPDDLQEAMLLRLFQELDDLEEEVDRAISAWINGDHAAMHKLIRDEVLKEPKLAPLYVELFDKRNVKMAAKIEQYLKGKEPVFVVVGAGHIPGETGILKLLEKKGYTIKQVQRAQ